MFSLNLFFLSVSRQSPTQTLRQLEFFLPVYTILVHPKFHCGYFAKNHASNVALHKVTNENSTIVVIHFFNKKFSISRSLTPSPPLRWLIAKISQEFHFLFHHTTSFDKASYVDACAAGIRRKNVSGSYFFDIFEASIQQISTCLYEKIHVREERSLLGRQFLLWFSIQNKDKKRFERERARRTASLMNVLQITISRESDSQSAARIVSRYVIFKH